MVWLEKFVWKGKDFSIVEKRIYLIAEGKILVVISGVSVYGVRHGFETFSQLIIPYDINGNACLATLSLTNITDKPVYRHRGLLIDTARNFLSVDSIKRNIDGMASCKLNVLHWHISDSQSFPLESRRLPNMTKWVKHLLSMFLQIPWNLCYYYYLNQIVHKRLHIN